MDEAIQPGTSCVAVRTAAQEHRLGVLLQVGSAFAFSLAGFFTRLIAMDAPTLLFWRGIGSSVSVAFVVAWLYRGQVRRTLRASGGWGLVAAMITAFCMTTFIWSLRLTSVAEVSIIYAAVPLATAALGWLLLREPAGWRMLAACAVTVVGVAVMVGGGATSGHLAGDLLTVAMTIVTGLLMVLIRWRRDIPMLPAMGGAAFLTSVLAWPFAAPLGATAGDIGYALLFGVTQNGLGLMLMTLGARRVTATEMALYATLDAPLAPLWVWAAFAETPAVTTFAGGAIVMGAVATYLLSARGRT